MRLLPGRLFFWFVIVLIIHGVVSELAAQPIALPTTEELTERQGLPQSFVSSIVQDRQGFIWMATRDGLCRYDGQRFRVFQVASSAKTALSFPDVYNLTLDRQGQLWIKSEQNKMDVLDPASETFRNITLEPFYRRHFGDDTLWDICPDRRGRVWLLMRDNGLVCWGLRTNQYRRFQHTGQPNSLRNNTVRDVKEDLQGNIWVATDQGLDRFDERRGEFIHYPVADNALPDPVLGRLLVRKNGDLLIHSRRHLTLLHTKTGQVRAYPLPVLNDKVWWEARFTSDSRGNDYLLWLNRIFRFNEQSGLQHLPELTQGITAKSIFVDRSDVLWIGTNGAGSVNTTCRRAVLNGIATRRISVPTCWCANWAFRWPGCRSFRRARTRIISGMPSMERAYCGSTAGTRFTA